VVDIARAPARFLALGMSLALVPACATFPDDRLLFLAGFGGSGLVALVLAGVRERADWLPVGAAPRRVVRGVAAAAVVLHLVLAPLGLAATAPRLAAFDRVMDRAASSLPSNPEVSTQKLVVVTTPSAFVASYAPLIQLLKGRTIAASGLVLGSGIHATTVDRPAVNVLVIRPEAGFLAPPGTPAGASGGGPAIDPRFFFQALDLLYHDSTPFPLGWTVEIADASLEVTKVTADGRPAELTCTFATELESPWLRWLRWDDGIWVPFELPAVGETVVLPAVTVPPQGVSATAYAACFGRSHALFVVHSRYASGVQLLERASVRAPRSSEIHRPSQSSTLLARVAPARRAVVDPLFVTTAVSVRLIAG